MFKRKGSSHWQWKKVVKGVQFTDSLETDNDELACARRDAKEAELVAGELARLRTEKSAATLGRVFEVRDQIGGVTDKARKGSQNALLNIIYLAVPELKDKPAEELSLTLLTPKLLRDYQDAMCRNYEAAAGPAQKDKTAARLKAERTSKSLIAQARSLFAKNGKVKELVARYQEAGLVIPDNVAEFMKTSVRGKAGDKDYLPPSDEVLRQTFLDIEALAGGHHEDRELYELFWAVIAFGGRRNEALDMRVADVVEINGQLWVNGGLGKDGRTIQLPLVNWPVHAASTTVPAKVVAELVAKAKASGREYLFEGTHHYRQDLLPRRANAWLLARGWRDEKKLHALRAYIGSLLYLRDPFLARDYLRHKHLSTTEEFYTHFVRMMKQMAQQPTWVAAPVATTAPQPPAPVVQTGGS